MADYQRKGYEDPRQHFERHVDRAARQYVDGMQRLDLEPHPRLMRAIAERTLREAQDDYQHQCETTLSHNIDVIVRKHRYNMNEIKRSGAKMRRMLCPAIALWFGFIAWLNFSGGDKNMGILLAMFASAFLLMLIFGEIFDRPENIDGKVK
jgi:hypothetical protein